MIDMRKYEYDLPERLIAKKPAEPRDSCRLMVYDTANDKVFFDRFKNVGNYLPKESLLVLNETKVVPARIMLKKETGGKVEVLLLLNEGIKNGLIRALVDRKLIPGAILYFGKRMILKVIKQNGKYFYLKSLISLAALHKLLDTQGLIPVPKYLGDTSLSWNELKIKYQNVFAKSGNSVAAPTAGLHFTKSLFQKLKSNKHDIAHINLDVGLGTFAPLTEDNLKIGRLHQEYFSISSKDLSIIRKIKSVKHPIIAVGTTTVRVLESANNIIFKNGTKKIVGSTDIFIRSPYKFKSVSGLITNFHLPKSSLMLLVDAFLKDKRAKKSLLWLYKLAIKKRFRFYSFGDAMLII
jgi:S-adenosylmethionine:tRNA ribosyltransferase-isomerase